VRRASAPVAGTTGGAVNMEQQQGRMAKGWKPQLQDQVTNATNSSNVKRRGSRAHIPRSSSAELLSKFSPDSSPDDNTVNLRNELERELDGRLALGKRESVRKSRSESPLRHSDLPGRATSLFPRDVRLSRMPQEPRIMKRNSETRLEVGMGLLEGKEKKRMTFDEVKNKPLPKIAAL